MNFSQFYSDNENRSRRSRSGRSIGSHHEALDDNLLGPIAVLHLGRELWDIDNDDVSKMAEGGGIDDVGW